MNPWLSIWIRPRATIRQVIATDPERHVWILAALAGIGRALDRAHVQHAGDHLEWPFIVLAALIVGPLIGVGGLYLGAAVLRWTGRWFGGTAAPAAIRAAIAWAGAIQVWALVLWLPEAAVFGQELFKSDMPSVALMPGLLWVLLGFGLANAIVGLWELTVLVAVIAEVQGFSIGRALASLALSVLVLVAAASAVALPLRLLGGV